MKTELSLLDENFLEIQIYLWFTSYIHPLCCSIHYSSSSPHLLSHSLSQGVFPFTGVTKMFELMSGVNVVKQEWSELRFTQTQAQFLYMMASTMFCIYFPQLCQTAWTTPQNYGGQLKTILECFMTVCMYTKWCSTLWSSAITAD